MCFTVGEHMMNTSSSVIFWHFLTLTGCREIVIRSISLLMVFMICHEISDCQTWKNYGGPGGIYSNDILFTKYGRLIGSTNQGIFISDDFGNSWQNKTIDQDIGTIYTMMERSNAKIMAIASNGIIESADSGFTWTVVYPMYRLNDYGTFILESRQDSSLYYGADKSFFKSTDNGRHWSMIRSGNIVDCYAITDSGWIYIFERSVGLLKSVDKGITFKVLHIGYINSELHISKILANQFGELYLKVTNFPEKILHFENQQVTDVNSGWGNSLLGIDLDGNLIYKQNKSIALYNRITKESSILSSPPFVKDQFAQKAIVFDNVWITSFSSEGIHRSTDKGVTWTDINDNYGQQMCLSLYIDNKNTIYTGTFGFGFWGGLYSSSDSGKTWTDMNPLNYNAYITNLNLLNNGNLIAGGSYGTFIYNPDRQFWNRADSISFAFSQFVSKNGNIFVGNDYYGIYISTDNGYSFTKSNNGLNHYYFFAFGESKTGRIFAAAWPTGAYYSDDNGRKWTAINSDPFSYARAYDFKYKNDTLFAAVSHGIAISTNNGTTWKLLSTLTWQVQKIIIVPNGDIIASVADKGIYRSKDNGANWEPFKDGLSNFMVRDFALTSSDRLFAATDAGIFVTDEYAKTLNIIKDPVSPIQSLMLRQNYPNPFNSSTIISFYVPFSARYSLKVYNLVGEEISILLNQELIKGDHQYSWNATHLASGVYFLLLQSNSSSKIIKTLYLK